ncbi:MAG: ribonuclease P component 1 family protein [Thermoplasmatota archaeon]
MKNHYGKLDQQEFIGSDIEIIDAKNDSYKTIEGSVVDETMNTIVVKTPGNRLKVVPKKGKLFKFKINDYSFELKGNKINNRPEERIKKSG